MQSTTAARTWAFRSIGAPSSDGILTCHWHHARFDLATGGTFDQFADELRRFPVTVRGDDVLVDLTALDDPVAHQRKRLRRRARARHLTRAREGDDRTAGGRSERESASSVPGSTSASPAAAAAGARLDHAHLPMNLAPRLDVGERAPALYHGLAEVASDSAMQPPRFPLDPLPGAAPGVERLAAWFRRFVEVRDAEGAERALVSAARAGASPRAIADMLFVAATDHRYIDGGHTLDFINKAFEALDLAGWERAEQVLALVPAQLAGAARTEEANAWRIPVDLVALARALLRRPRRGARGRRRPARWLGRPCRARRGDPRQTTRPRSSPPSSRRCETAQPRSRSPRPSRSPPRPGSPASRRERVRRLGHGASYVHLRERRRARPAPVRVGRSPARRLRCRS